MQLPSRITLQGEMWDCAGSLSSSGLCCGDARDLVGCDLLRHGQQEFSIRSADPAKRRRNFVRNRASLPVAPHTLSVAVFLL